MAIPDRTNELSFEEPNNACVEKLLETGVVVVKDVLPPDAEQAVAIAYHAARRRALHRPIPAKLLAKVGGDDSWLHRKIKARDVGANPHNLPRHMRVAQTAITPMLELNEAFSSHPRITKVYPNMALTHGLFALSLTEEAFKPHQDNIGATGLAYAAQLKRTLYGIHFWAPEPPTPIAYTFETQPRDVVVLAERVGECPEVIPFRQGERKFEIDASPIHSGINLDGGPRYGLGLFTVERNETI